MFTLTFKHLRHTLLGAMAMGAVLLAQAQTLSQTPLLTLKTVVEPNLVLSLDTSGSMEAQFMFRYGGNEHGYGRAGPENVSQNDIINKNGNGVNMTANCTGATSMTATCTYSTPGSTRYHLLSPDVNSLTYDPRIRYKTRVDSTGTVDTPGSTAVSTAAVTTSTTAFFVYFYKDGSGNSATWLGTGNSPTATASYFDPYTPVNALLISGATPSLSYPRSVATGTGPFPRFLNRTDCNGGAATGGSCSLAEERLNYAIWKKYHSTRLDLAKTGLGWAFDQIGPTLRLGWGTIFDMKAGNLHTGVGLFESTHRSNFYTWLYSRPSTWDGTPNLQAVETMGKYFSRSDNSGPWSTTPVTTSTVSASIPSSGLADDAARSAHLSCRRSYAMLITDGYYDGTTSVGNVDSTSQPTVTGSTVDGSALTYTYNGTTAPYPGGGTNTMADIAMKYWVTDLRGTGNYPIDNKVKVIDDTVVAGVTTSVGNESFWQNMSFYGVGLGVYGTLPQTDAVLANIKNGVANINNAGNSVTGWPTAATFTEESMDDMWHATVNGRGRMLSAKNSDTLSDGVESMLAKINEVTDSQAGVAASTTGLETNTRKYSPLYTSGLWTGNIVASKLNGSNATDACIAWQISGAVITGPSVAPACTLATNGVDFTTNNMPAHGSRNIVAWNGTTYGNFDSGNTHVQTNVVGGSTASLINYLRGDQSEEDTPIATKLYRPRTTILGDIVNSTPSFIQGRLDMGYSSLPTNTNGQATYAAFLKQKADRPEGVLFAGANDGMLHGFRDSTGAEVFAFVPRDVMPRMHELAKRSYNHKYYVDGPTVEADACLGIAEEANKNCTQAEWRNLLLGTLGAGGKSVYAIDVTTITASPTMGLGASNVLWEITTGTAGYTNLGHIFTEVQTGVTTGGQWVAIFGNGYYGADGKAYLYVADLKTGKNLAAIQAGTSTSNGLSGPTLVRDANQRIIGAYAGDLKGNMWKFDLSSATISSWKLGLASSSALFAPVGGQAVTAPPAVVSHPDGGRVVVFGSGKFFDTLDPSSTAQQTFYGIWDSVPFNDTTTTGVSQTGTGNLVQQTTVTATGTYVTTNPNGTTQTVNFTGFVQSDNTINWTSKRGWYMNMKYSGERLVYRMKQLFGSASRIYMAGTLIPAVTSSAACTATQSGSGSAYIFDLLTGGTYNPDPLKPLPPLPPQPPVPPNPICNSSACFTIKPTEPGCSVNCNPDTISFKCGAQTGVACPSSIKRTWRQLFMR